MFDVVHIIGRVSLSAVFISAGVDMMRKPERSTRRAAEALGLPDEPMIGRLHGATMVTAGSALALGIAPSLSALTLALTLVPTTYVGHPYWKEPDPELRRGQRNQFLKNLGLFGGLLLTALKERNHQS